MDIKITPSTITGVVNAPPSKSYSHRYIIASFLSKTEGFIDCCAKSKDILATLNCLKNLGLLYTFENGGVSLKFGKAVENPIIDCDESGSTLRFLIPILSALGVKCQFTGSKRLLERPIKDLTNCLNENGADIDGLKLNGKLKSGKFTINGGVSSQFITGLLFALPLLNGDSVIEIVGEIVSQNYIDITLGVLNDFGVSVTKTPNSYLVKGNQEYKMPSKIVVEGDYSNSAFLLAMGALGEGVTVLNLNKNSKQGDSKIIDILKEFGAIIKGVENGFSVKKGDLKGVTVDCENIPDIVQILAVVASFSDGKSVFKKVNRLEIKESNRILGIINNLNSAGIKAEYDGNNLTVYGGKVGCGAFNGDNDHRTVMSAVVLSAFSSGESIVKGVEAVNKSYPIFFEDFKGLGGITDGDI
jgi:3-phosphoshikimate 1-carboxyvinyltransferase